MKKAITLLCLLALLMPLLLSCRGEPFAGLAVEVLDVGQSDCSLITIGDAVMMIDTGTVTERGTLRAALRRRGIEHLDYLVLTHPHEDHVGNARMLLETYTVGALIVPTTNRDSFDYALVMDAAEGTDTAVQTVSAGQTFSLGEAEVEILLAAYDVADPNNGSIVLRVSYGETAFLFTGDNEEAGEATLLETVAAEKLECDFLKAGHHGSANATGKELLAAATPLHVAVSCGAGNSYGFPDEAVLARLRAEGAVCHRTDTEGDLRYCSNGNDVWFEE